MPEAVQEIRPEAAVADPLPRGTVHRTADRACAGRLYARVLRLENQIVDLLFLRIDRAYADHARHIGAIAVHTGADIQHDEIAAPGRASRRLYMRLGGIRAAAAHVVEGIHLRAHLINQHADHPLNRDVRHPRMDVIERFEKDAVRDVLRRTNARELLFPFHASPAVNPFFQRTARNHRAGQPAPNAQRFHRNIRLRVDFSDARRSHGRLQICRGLCRHSLKISGQNGYPRNRRPPPAKKQYLRMREEKLRFRPRIGPDIIADAGAAAEQHGAVFLPQQRTKGCPAALHRHGGQRLHGKAHRLPAGYKARLQRKPDAEHAAGRENALCHAGFRFSTLHGKFCGKGAAFVALLPSDLPQLPLQALQ